MEIVFIRHGHGEHLDDYPNRLNTLHPSLTPYGKFQVARLRDTIRLNSEDLVLVSPTKRTVETAIILKNNDDFVITPLVGPRMFPQNPELSPLACDHILSRAEIMDLYSCVKILDFDLDCWLEGINRIDQEVFEGYAKILLEWVRDSYDKVFIISHDGTITNYRMLLGEKGLTRKDFLGEAGVHKVTV